MARRLIQRLTIVDAPALDAPHGGLMAIVLFGRAPEPGERGAISTLIARACGVPPHMPLASRDVAIGPRRAKRDSKITTPTQKGEPK